MFFILPHVCCFFPFLPASSRSLLPTHLQLHVLSLFVSKKNQNKKETKIWEGRGSRRKGEEKLWLVCKNEFKKMKKYYFHFYFNMVTLSTLMTFQPLSST